MTTTRTGKAQSHKTAVLLVIVASYLMIVIDISIVLTALPKIHEVLHFSTNELSWVQNAYTLAFGGLLLLGSRAGDLVGRRRMFVIGLALFTVASLAVGLAQSAAWLLIARAVQGVGAAVLAPSTLALITTTFSEGPERTRAVSYYGAAAGIGASVGLVLGGIVTDWISWRWGFFINVPIGIALIVAGLRYLPETERHSGALDVRGALSSTLGMTALVYGIVRAADVGWSDPFTITAIATGVVLLGLFVVNEWRAAQPIMPLGLFNHRVRNGAYLGRLLFLAGMVGFWFFIAQYLQIVREYSPTLAGLAFLATALPNLGSALLVPRLTRRFRSAHLLVVGLLIFVTGMAWLSRIGVDSSYFGMMFVPMVLVGLGQGAVLGPLTGFGVTDVDSKVAGAASGVVNVAHQMGSTFGLAVLVTISAGAGAAFADDRLALAHRVSAALTAEAVILALALITALVLIVRRPSSRAAA